MRLRRKNTVARACLRQAALASVRAHLHGHRLRETAWPREHVQTAPPGCVDGGTHPHERRGAPGVER